MDKITKLSQAIRLGATFRPKANAQLFCSLDKTSCALGAAAEALGIVDWDHPPDDFTALFVDVSVSLERRFPELKVLDEHYPGNHGCLQGTITHLNDSLDWSREDIADWLETKGL